MTLYSLVAVFLLSGDSYVERRHLSLHQCAGQAAMVRQQTSGMEDQIGEVRYLCVPEKPVRDM